MRIMKKNEFGFENKKNSTWRIRKSSYWTSFGGSRGVQDVFKNDT